MNPALRIWIMLAAGLTACAVVPPPDAPVSAEPCVAACERRTELGCLEPELAPQCVPVCVKATAAGLYDPGAVVRAKDATEMLLAGVRDCSP